MKSLPLVPLSILVMTSVIAAESLPEKKGLFLFAFEQWGSAAGVGRHYEVRTEEIRVSDRSDYGRPPEIYFYRRLSREQGLALKKAIETVPKRTFE